MKSVGLPSFEGAKIRLEAPAMGRPPPPISQSLMIKRGSPLRVEQFKPGGSTIIWYRGGIKQDKCAISRHPVMFTSTAE